MKLVDFSSRSGCYEGWGRADEGRCQRQSRRKADDGAWEVPRSWRLQAAAIGNGACMPVLASFVVTKPLAPSSPCSSAFSLFTCRCSPSASRTPVCGQYRGQGRWGGGTRRQVRGPEGGQGDRRRAAGASAIRPNKCKQAQMLELILIPNAPSTLSSARILFFLHLNSVVAHACLRRMCP